MVGAANTVIAPFQAAATGVVPSVAPAAEAPANGMATIFNEARPMLMANGFEEETPGSNVLINKRVVAQGLYSRPSHGHYQTEIRLPYESTLTTRISLKDDGTIEVKGSYDVHKDGWRTYQAGDETIAFHKFVFGLGEVSCELLGGAEPRRFPEPNALIRILEPEERGRIRLVVTKSFFNAYTKAFGKESTIVLIPESVTSEVDTVEIPTATAAAIGADVAAQQILDKLVNRVGIEVSFNDPNLRFYIRFADKKDWTVARLATEIRKRIGDEIMYFDQPTGGVRLEAAAPAAAAGEVYIPAFFKAIYRGVRGHDYVLRKGKSVQAIAFRPKRNDYRTGKFVFSRSVYGNHQNQISIIYTKLGNLFSKPVTQSTRMNFFFTSNDGVRVIKENG